MGKKQKDVLDKMKPKFLKNSEKKGFKIEKVEKDMERLGGFCKLCL